MTVFREQKWDWRPTRAVVWLLSAVVLAIGAPRAIAGSMPLVPTSVRQAQTPAAIPAVKPHVTLRWKPSSSNVVGYYVYRADKSGGPYTKITRLWVAGTQYVDQDVTRGRTYFYVVTSVDPRGVEGRRSGEIRATVPQG
jgi:fibronectin type 3 domain-containing protein